MQSSGSENPVGRRDMDPKTNELTSHERSLFRISQNVSKTLDKQYPEHRTLNQEPASTKKEFSDKMIVFLTLPTREKDRTVKKVILVPSSITGAKFLEVLYKMLDIERTYVSLNVLAITSTSSIHITQETELTLKDILMNQTNAVTMQISFGAGNLVNSISNEANIENYAGLRNQLRANFGAQLTETRDNSQAAGNAPENMDEDEGMPALEMEKPTEESSYEEALPSNSSSFAPLTTVSHSIPLKGKRKFEQTGANSVQRSSNNNQGPNAQEKMRFIANAGGTKLLDGTISRRNFSDEDQRILQNWQNAKNDVTRKYWEPKYAEAISRNQTATQLSTHAHQKKEIVYHDGRREDASNLSLVIVSNLRANQFPIQAKSEHKATSLDVNIQQEQIRLCHVVDQSSNHARLFNYKISPTVKEEHQYVTTYQFGFDRERVQWEHNDTLFPQPFQVERTIQAIVEYSRLAEVSGYNPHRFLEPYYEAATNPPILNQKYDAHAYNKYYSRRRCDWAGVDIPRLEKHAQYTLFGLRISLNPKKRNEDQLKKLYALLKWPYPADATTSSLSSIVHNAAAPQDPIPLFNSFTTQEASPKTVPALPIVIAPTKQRKRIEEVVNNINSRLNCQEPKETHSSTSSEASP